jgi:hypothetical protein
MFIGLMGIDAYGTLYSPNGNYLMRIPFGNSRHHPKLHRVAVWVACRIQTLQHWIACKTWRA